jgi:CRISPR-associated endonuclease/helicase Cas3
MVKEWLERDIDIDWRVKRLIESKTDEGEENHTEYGWERLSEPGQLTSTQIIAVNPELAGYLKDEGFVANHGNTGFVSTMPDIDEQKTYAGFSYKIEAYEDHIKRVLDALEDVSAKELIYSARALEDAAGWTKGSVMRAIWYACLFHDVGKLSEGWQRWARAYQKQINMPVPNTFAAGHTEHEWNNQDHKEAEGIIRKKYPKPNHAGEGVLAIARMAARAFSEKEEDLAKALFTAITRHHTPFASECGMFVLEDQAQTHIRATLAHVSEDIRQPVNLELLRSESKTKQNSFSSLLVSPDDDFGWMAYTLLVRALRRSDQMGTARGTR